jgi:photosystem II stability/assembly factor-like uncharacterized protein
VANYLLEQDCDFVGRINYVCRAPRADVTNYEVAVLMHGSELDSPRLSDAVAGTAENVSRVNTEGDVVFDTLQLLYQLTINQQTVTNTADAYDVYFLPKQCDNRCGLGRDMCGEGIIGLDGSGYTYDSEIKKTDDGGATWAETTVDPFTYGGNVHAVLMMENVSGPKLIVFRSAAVGGFPAEVAISEDWGATWTNYEIGSLGGQYVNSYGLNGANIFVVATDGYIYKSTDIGVTWSTVEDGTETSEDLNDIAFADQNVGFAVGDSNAFLVTEDGGTTWTAGTGPAAGTNLLTVATNDKGHVFIGNNAGEIWVSEDDGETWVERLDMGSGSIEWIEFDPEAEYVGGMIWNTAAPVGYLYRSEDGGATWQRVPDMPTNAGLNGGHICDPNHMVVVGNAYSGTTFIAKTQPTG